MLLGLEVFFLETWSLNLATGPGLEAERVIGLLIRKGCGDSGSSIGSYCGGVLSSSSNSSASVLLLALGRSSDSSSASVEYLKIHMFKDG